ncbi:unnamed protein product [Mesocestoides corti]|uniref:THAP-type domain-containing protein n=1 Tax=Mesocestoides corti TaxID=53468 RepID=A0A0R3UIX9_MESCO|nr:unnamed protein product [Mesocestoides corti]
MSYSAAARGVPALGGRAASPTLPSVMCPQTELPKSRKRLLAPLPLRHYSLFRKPSKENLWVVDEDHLQGSVPPPPHCEHQE